MNEDERKLKENKVCHGAQNFIKPTFAKLEYVGRQIALNPRLRQIVVLPGRTRQFQQSYLHNRGVRVYYRLAKHHLTPCVQAGTEEKRTYKSGSNE